VGGQVTAANSAKKQGKADMAAAYEQAADIEKQGEADYALSTHHSDAVSRRVAEITAQQRAAAAAGGASSDDATVEAHMDETLRQGSLEQLITLAEGEAKRNNANKQAVQVRKQGDNAFAAGKAKRRAGLMAAAGTVLSSGMDWADKFGGAPAPTPTPGKMYA
jgi:hypothetical protein